MRSWVADYEIVQSLGRDDARPRIVLARPPDRLAAGTDQVVLHVFDGLGDDKSETLIRRLRTVAAIRSPGLPVLFEAGRADHDGSGATYYTTEYIRAGSLNRQASTLGTAGRLRAVADAARAAHDLHEAGLVHGDIRPSTILLGERGGVLTEPLPVDLMEPGLAGRAEDPVDLETIDPAILHGDGRSRATDIWALGATLHSVLTGRLLHTALAGDPAVTAVQRIMFERPVIDRQLPEQYSRAIRSCLAPDPFDRPASAAELAAQLTDLIAAP